MMTLALTTAELLVNGLQIYLVSGLLFAGGFLMLWIGRLDPLAAHASWRVRLLLLPGSVLLWPLLAGKLLRGRSGEDA